MNKVTLILQESEDNEAFNNMLLDFITDRHKYINDNNYVIAIEIIDNTNLNTFIKKGITSTPALLLDYRVADSTGTKIGKKNTGGSMQGTNPDIIYGVNAILAELSKLEFSKHNNHPENMANNMVNNIGADMDSLYRERLIKELTSKDDDDDNDRASTVWVKNQDVSDGPPNDKDRDLKLSKYESYYTERSKRNKTLLPGNKTQSSGKDDVDSLLTTRRGSNTTGNYKVKSQPDNGSIYTKKQTEKLIEKHGYDKGEAALMRSFADRMSSV